MVMLRGAFLELRGFETVSNGFYHVPCLPVR